MTVSVTVLFVPFDAKKQHYERNARNGVKGSKLRRVNPDPAWDGSDMAVEGAVEAVDVRTHGQAMTQSAISDQLARIIDGICREALAEEPQSLRPVSKKRGRDEREYGFSPNSYPMFVFVSEVHSSLQLPSELTVGPGVEYTWIGANEAQLGEQKIAAYVRTSPKFGGEWRARPLQKQSPTHKKTEHVLVIDYVFFGYRCSVAGVHLSSKNTGASKAVRDIELQAVATFCQQENIQVAIGDFNLDLRGVSGGGVGAIPGQTSFTPNRTGGSAAITYHQQFTNSSNTAHYMGYVVADQERLRLTGVGTAQLFGLSLRREGDAGYFSDHAPIFLKLESMVPTFSVPSGPYLLTYV